MNHFKANNYYRWTLSYVAAVVTLILALTVMGLL